MGANSAAAAAAQMKAAFSSIEFSLLVGIGGGVPSKEQDIRLGDVVISKPQAGHGGVVQDDFGKTIAGGHTVRSGFLNAPPDILLTTPTKLLSNQYQSRSGISTHLSAFENFPKFQRGGDDILFEASCNHFQDAIPCRDCDKNKIIQRLNRINTLEIIVHYGTVASGNQVMKDAVTRDKISKDLGGVMCFEMEAAGVINILPSLVIRGVCNYSDSHKNKSWQGFAAATAAACAKEILSLVPRYDIKTGRVDVPREIQSTTHFMVPFLKNARFTGRETTPFEMMV